MDDREISIWAGGETSNYQKGGTCSFIPRGGSQTSAYELNSVVRGFGMYQKWHLCQPHCTSRLDCFLPHAICPSTFRDPSHNRALLAALHQKRQKSPYTPHPPPPPIYCLIKRLLVSFCISKTSMLVFPPHSAPFIIGWCRETYCSYISCNWSG